MPSAKPGHEQPTPLAQGAGATAAQEVATPVAPVPPVAHADLLSEPTKGPWIIDPPGNGDNIEFEIRGADGVAVVASHIQNPADADVIGAALEMQKALADAIPALVRMHAMTAGGQNKSLRLAQLNAARKALAKAAGGAHG